MTEIIFGNTENLHRQRRVPILPYRLVAELADEFRDFLWRASKRIFDFESMDFLAGVQVFGIKRLAAARQRRRHNQAVVK